jgi:hypothetical protein
MSIEGFKDLIRNYDTESNLSRLNAEIWKLLNEENNYSQKELLELDNFLRNSINKRFERQPLLSLTPQKRKISTSKKFDVNTYSIYGYELKLPWVEKAQIENFKHSTIILKKKKWALVCDNPEEIYLTPGSAFFEKIDQDPLYFLFLNQLPSNKFEFVEATLNTNVNDLRNAYNIRKKYIVFLLLNVKQMYLFDSNKKLRDDSSIYYFEDPMLKDFKSDPLMRVR